MMPIPAPTEPQPESTEHAEHSKPDVHKDREESRLLGDLIAHMVVVLNLDGKAIYANRVTLEYTGLSLDDVRAA